MRNVEFNGQKFEVPDWTRVITLDDYGTVTAWEQPPTRKDMVYVQVYPCRHQPVGFIRHLDRYKEVH